MFPLVSPHRGNSNEYTQYTNFNHKKQKSLNYSNSAAMGFCSKELNKKEYSTKEPLVNEPSVFEPLKFYCTSKSLIYLKYLSKYVI